MNEHDISDINERRDPQEVIGAGAPLWTTLSLYCVEGWGEHHLISCHAGNRGTPRNFSLFQNGPRCRKGCGGRSLAAGAEGLVSDSEPLSGVPPHGCEEPIVEADYRDGMWAAGIPSR